MCRVFVVAVLDDLDEWEFEEFLVEVDCFFDVFVDECCMVYVAGGARWMFFEWMEVFGAQFGVVLVDCG